MTHGLPLDMVPLQGPGFPGGVAITFDGISGSVSRRATAFATIEIVI